MVMEAVTLSDLGPIIAAVVGPMLVMVVASMRYQHLDSTKTRKLITDSEKATLKLITDSNDKNRDLIRGVQPGDPRPDRQEPRPDHGEPHSDRGRARAVGAHRGTPEDLSPARDQRRRGRRGGLNPPSPRSTIQRPGGQAGRGCPAGQLPPGRGLGCVQPCPRAVATLQSRASPPAEGEQPAPVGEAARRGPGAGSRVRLSAG